MRVIQALSNGVKCASVWVALTIGGDEQRITLAQQPGAQADNNQETGNDSVVERDPSTGLITRVLSRKYRWIELYSRGLQVPVLWDQVTPEGARRSVYDDYGELCLPFQPSEAGTSIDLYINELAQRLVNPETLARYFKCYWSYTSDGVKKDKWQSPQETCLRATGVSYLGDCEDLAFFAAAILQAQGRMPLVIYTGGHAACVFIESKGDGFIPHCLCTYGYDVGNGPRDVTAGEYLNALFEDSQPKVYSSVEEALSCVVAKYKCGKTLQGVRAMSFTRQDKKYLVPIETFVDRRLYQIVNEIIYDNPAVNTEYLVKALGCYPDLKLVFPALLAAFRETLKAQEPLGEIEVLLQGMPDLALRNLLGYVRAHDFPKADVFSLKRIFELSERSDLVIELLSLRAELERFRLSQLPWSPQEYSKRTIQGPSPQMGVSKLRAKISRAPLIAALEELHKALRESGENEIADAIRLELLNLEIP